MKFLLATALVLAALLSSACGSTPVGTGGADGGGTVQPAQDGGSTGGPSEDGGTTNPAADGGSVEPGGIVCGNAVCDTNTQDCCVTTSAECVAKGSCGGTTFSCSSRASCPDSEVCCVDIGNGAASASCAPDCGPNGVQLCASDAECPAGTTCQPTRFGVDVCSPSFDGGGPRDGGFGGFDGGGPGDGGFDGGTVADTCGACTFDTQDCCLSFQGASCEPAGTCNGSSLSCVDGVACNNGDVCCATLVQNTISATCSQDCTGDAGLHFQLCTGNGDCHNGTTCVSGAFGLRFCASAGGGPLPGGVGN